MLRPSGSVPIWTTPIPAQNGELISQLNEITAELSAETAVSRPGGVSALGQTTAGTEALLSPLRMGFRYLSNPTGQGATGTVINFLLFFSLMFHGSQAS